MKFNFLPSINFYVFNFENFGCLNKWQEPDWLLFCQIRTSECDQVTYTSGVSSAA